MTAVVETHVDAAREHVREESTATREKRAAFEAFVERVAALSPEPVRAGVAAADGGPDGDLLGQNAAGRSDGGCHRVRAAFADTVRPHSVADLGREEPLLATVRAELSKPIATALAATTDAALTPDLRAAIVAASRERCAELRATERALDRERDQLERAAATASDVTGWLVDADETLLTSLGFDALRERHATLARHRERCDELAADRQAFLREDTRENARVAVEHRGLVEYTYRDAAPTYPVLATVANLDAACADCQRVVRDHLTRRA